MEMFWPTALRRPVVRVNDCEFGGSVPKRKAETTRTCSNGKTNIKFNQSSALLNSYFLSLPYDYVELLHSGTSIACFQPWAPNARCSVETPIVCSNEAAPSNCVAIVDRIYTSTKAVDRKLLSSGSFVSHHSMLE